MGPTPELHISCINTLYSVDYTSSKSTSSLTASCSLTTHWLHNNYIIILHSVWYILHTFQHFILLTLQCSVLIMDFNLVNTKVLMNQRNKRNNRIEREVSVGSKCPSFKFLFLRTQVKLCKFKHVYTCVHFAGTCVFSKLNISLGFVHKEGPLPLSMDRPSSEKIWMCGWGEQSSNRATNVFSFPPNHVFVADIWGSITIMICGDEWSRD